MPPQVQELLKLLDDVEGVAITASADADPLVRVEVAGADDAAAGAIQQQLEPLLKMGQQMFPFVVENMTEQTPAIEPLAVVVGDVVNAASLVQNESRVVFTVPRTESLDAVEDWLGPLAQAREQEEERAGRQNVVFELQRWLDSHGPMPGNIYAEGGDKPLLSWRVKVMHNHYEPLYLDNGIDEDGDFTKPSIPQFNLQESWDSEHNMPLLQASAMSLFESPGAKPGHTVYLAFQGPGTMIDGNKKKTELDMKDGISGTIAVVEVSPERAVPWTQPIDIDITAEDVQTMLGPPPKPEGYPAMLFDGRLIIAAAGHRRRNACASWLAGTNGVPGRL